MELIQRVAPKIVRYHGADNFTVTSGKHLKIETSPAGEEILNVVVPTGKTWTVRVELRIYEK